MAQDIEGEEPTDMSADEEAAVFGEDGIEEEGDGAAAPAESDALPPWAFPLPPTLKVPLEAKVTFMRVCAHMTAKPSKGDRVIAVWPLTDQEERQAVNRARGDQYGLSQELAKATIRAFDGHPADRTGNAHHPGNVSVLWRDLGPKGRSIVRTYYTRMHSLTGEEVQDFFLHSVVTRTAVPG